MRYFLLLISLLCTSLSGRDWTSSDGQSYEGKLLSVENEVVKIIRTSDQKVITLKVESLSEEDKAYIASEQKKDEDKKDAETVLFDDPEEAIKASKEKGVIAYIYYTNAKDRGVFEEFFNLFYRDPKLLNAIKGKAVICILENKKEHIQFAKKYPLFKKRMKPIDIVQVSFYKGEHEGTNNDYSSYRLDLKRFKDPKNETLAEFQKSYLEGVIENLEFQIDQRLEEWDALPS